MSVFHDKVAHLMRTGTRATPRRASRSPSFTSATNSASSSAFGSSIDIIALNARVSARASARVLPFTAADIIDAADDWLIEQPCPPILTSVIVSPSTCT